MKGKRFKEEQIIRILHEAERGSTVAEVCRQHNCSEQSFYRWKVKFGGMEVSDVKRLRGLQQENSELKKIVAEQSLDRRMLKDVNSRKW
jgi:putative transposase